MNWMGPINILNSIRFFEISLRNTFSMLSNKLYYFNLILNVNTPIGSVKLILNSN
jgi:hypothetical protein